MLTPKEEYEYYMNMYEQSLILGKRDPEYMIVAQRFKLNAERWKKKIIVISTPSGKDDPLYQQFNKGQQK